MEGANSDLFFLICLPCVRCLSRYAYQERVSLVLAGIPMPRLAESIRRRTMLSGVAAAAGLLPVLGARAQTVSTPRYGTTQRDHGPLSRPTPLRTRLFQLPVLRSGRRSDAAGALPGRRRSGQPAWLVRRLGPDELRPGAASYRLRIAAGSASCQARAMKVTPIAAPLPGKNPFGTAFAGRSAGAPTAPPG